MNIFTSLDPAVKKLLGWKMGDEEEKWALKAVESLVKKMHKRKNQGFGTVEDLEYALAHPGSHSNCVTIPRSLDGRLQVSHRKGLPHVIYCRVWRWPNLQSHQIGKIPPTRINLFAPIHELRPTSDCMFPYDGRSEHICINPYHYQRVEPSGQGKGTSQQQRAWLPEGSPPQQMSPSPYSPKQCGPVKKTSAPLVPISSSSSSSSASSSTSSLGPSSQRPPFPFTQSPSSALSDDDDFVGQHFALSSHHLMVPPQPVFWCSICYYELNSRVGELFKSAVTVDGFTNPSSEGRICLGLLSNVNRNATVENTRRHIGMGIRLTCTESGVLLMNQSDAAVFVQSRNANFKYSLQPTAVCRVPSGATMFIFDYLLFGGMLEKAKADGYQHVYEIVKMCFVRLSFVKGWGADYQRQDVTSTPCWLELQLHQPMAWIDSALAELDPPDQNGITSVS